MAVPLSFWQMHVKDWSQRLITYSTTIRLYEEGVPMAAGTANLTDMQSRVEPNVITTTLYESM